MRGVGMKRWELKTKDDCSFWSSAKFCKVFSKINYSVNSSLQKWIIYHTHLIQSPIVNDYIKVKFDDRNGGVNNELCQKVFIQLSVHELQIYMLKQYATGFSIAYDKKLLVKICGSDLLLLLPPQLQNMNQRHQIMRGYKKFIQAVT